MEVRKGRDETRKKRKKEGSGWKEYRRREN